MMSRFMSYQIVILNGERHGERIAVGQTALTIGRSNSCDLPLPDPLANDVHAMIVPAANGLAITAQGESTRVVLNNAIVTQSSLKHGDIVEIGSTRLFIQTQGPSATWESLAGFHKWRRWITLGVPLLILIATPLALKRGLPTADPTPSPSPAPGRAHVSVASDTNDADWMVTNVPSVTIHASITLTSLPPEIVEAREIVLLTVSNHVQQEIELALRDVEFATRFLDEAGQQQHNEPVSPSAATNEAETIQAEGLKH